MTARAANVKGITFNDGPYGSNNGGVAFVSFDLIATASTGGSDTLTLGGTGQDDGVTTTNSLAVIMQNRRRDGKTVTLVAVGGCVANGLQAGTALFPQAGTIGSGSITGVTLNTAATAGSSASSTSAGWDRAAMIAVSYVTSGTGVGS
jgi:hypothetical protein